MGDCLIVRRGGGGKSTFPTGLSVTTPPTKTSYKAGESIDLTGIVIMATYSDGSTADVTSECSFSPASGAVVYEDTSKITVSWEWERTITYSTSQSITVTRVLSSIAITTKPTKTSYTKGEALNLSGMVVTATFSSGKTAVVTSYTTSPAAGSAVTTVGTSTVTVSYTENSVTKTASFSISTSVKTVTWSTGSDADIVAMIEAADAGEIDLHDYWAVGDMRTVDLSAMPATNVGEAHAAQTVQLVLMDSTCTGFTFLSNKEKPRFIVGMYNCLKEYGYMNSTATNVGGWKESARRKWCNEELYDAIPSTLRSIFKQFIWQQGQGGKNASGLSTTRDYFGLAPEKAIFGSATNSYADEAALYDNWAWYQDGSHRVKYVSSAPVYYWECSPCPHTYYKEHFALVNIDNTPGYNTATLALGLSPFGCI